MAQSSIQKLNRVREEYPEFHLSDMLDTKFSLKPEDSELTKASELEAAFIEKGDEYESKLFKILYESEDGSISESIASTKLAEFYLLREVYRQSERDKPDIMQIMRHEKELYRHFSEDLFYQSGALKIRQLNAYGLSNAPEADEKRKWLLEILHEYCPESSNDTQEVDKDHVVAIIGEWLREEYAQQLALIDSNVKEYDARMLVEVFAEAIAITPELVDCGWTVEVVRRQKNAITVEARNRRIVVSSQKTATSEQLQKLMIHEVLGHALRSARAEIAGIEEGVIGTGTYEQFEEACMVALEQCVSGKVEPYRGVDSYLAVGLGLGVDGEPLSKAEVLEFIQASKIAEMANKLGRDLTQQEEAAELVKTMNVLKRIYAGMVSGEGGAVHMKEIDYFYGSQNSWYVLAKIVASGNIDEGMRWLMSGKFNPFEAADQEVFGSLEDICGKR